MEQELFDKILVMTAKDTFEEEVKKARAVYFEQMTDLREDDPSFDVLTACFLNWYIFERPMDSGRGTPLQFYAQEEKTSAKEDRLLAAMAANIYGLFEIVSIDAKVVLLRDLFTRERLPVQERRSVVGLRKRDIIEARLLAIDGRLTFLPGAFILFPRVARPYICHAVERARRGGTPTDFDLIRRLHVLTFRYTDRFRERVPAAKVFKLLNDVRGMSRMAGTN